MADFSTAYSLILKNEGGYQSNTADRGNYACGELVGTNWGISAPALQDWIGRCPTVQDSLGLPEQTAMQIYKVKYWDRIGGDGYMDQNVANMLLDMYVNQTGYFAGIVYQAALIQRPITTPNITVPTGSDVVNFINGLDQNKFFHDVKAGREAAYYYQSTKPGQYIFLDGWLARLRRLEWVATYKTPLTYGAVALLIIVLGMATYALYAQRKDIKQILQ